MTVSHSDTHVFQESKYLNYVAHKLFILRWFRRPCILAEAWKLPVTFSSRSPQHPVNLTCHRYFLQNTSRTYPLLSIPLSHSGPSHHSFPPRLLQLPSKTLCPYTRCFAHNPLSSPRKPDYVIACRKFFHRHPGLHHHKDQSP